MPVEALLEEADCRTQLETILWHSPHAPPPSPRALQGKVVRVVQTLASWLGMGRQWRAVANAPSLQAQRDAFEQLWVVRLLRAAPPLLLSVIADFAALLFFNHITLW